MKSSEVVLFGIRILPPYRPTRQQSSLFYIFISFLTSFLRFRLFVLKTEKNLGWRDESILKEEEMTSFSGNHFS